MKLLHEAILAADDALIFDNSTDAAGSPRLVFQSTAQGDGKLVRKRLIVPIPAWVQRYVLEPLELNSSTPQK
jgi:hypothetical protein